eukprot:CAMPEP_0119365120 /NCGR_PEP_ID=MMETSP1334-20130426/12055_1 /TAXON_ID=127549 /ORGANISM="Calcidiscus leptoporus, Strain RCC1130" /LENGTH=68 /DNA_ID=CAMNT_0007381009 /DNA_START=552 /DNA_END=755 /DNA_ORIENTATION=-
MASDAMAYASSTVAAVLEALKAALPARTCDPLALAIFRASLIAASSAHPSSANSCTRPIFSASAALIG